jgi:putative nucleotidyltransferase with HDIG domain
MNYFSRFGDSVKKLCVWGMSGLQRAIVERARHVASLLLSKITVSVVILIFAAAGAALFYPYSSKFQPFDLPREGEIAKQTIIAPFTYDVIKMPEELARERSAASSKVLLVLDLDQEAAKQVRRKMNELKGMICSPGASTRDSIPTAISISLNSQLSMESIKTLRRNPRIIDEACTGALRALDKGILATLIVPSPEKRAEMKAHFNTLFEKYLLYERDYVSVQKGSLESTVAVSEIPVKEQALESVVKSLKGDPRNDAASLNAVYELLYAVVTPNVFVNKAETDKRSEKAAQDVLPIKGKVIMETEIMRKHQVVTADIVERLYSLRKTQEQIDHGGRKFRSQAANAGDCLLLIAVVCFLAIYVKKFQWKSVKTDKCAFAVAFIVVFQAALVRLGLIIAPRLFESAGAETLTMEYIVPTSVGAMLAAILIDMRTSFIISLFTAVFFGMSLGYNLQMFLLALLTGMTAGFFTKGIRYRWDFIKAILPVSLVYAVVILILQVLSLHFSPATFLQNLGIAFINSIISVFIVMVSTMVFENLFDIATDMTLIELSDMNNPLLKRLSIEAAGTYNHSVLVGNLAESAAEKIGANSLMARVASYYHDIGKIEKADYFIENAHNKSRHARLAPSMSALIISTHVKEGGELAKQHKLPRVIRDAIMQHHGNSTVSYFYEKARQQDPHNQVQEEHFRYPGPIPQTRENAIIMLADSVEAASRSLSVSSPKLLRELAKKVIRDKFVSGQLDQCDLTLRDLDKIVEGFMPILQGIFHTRDTKERKIEQ